MKVKHFTMEQDYDFVGDSLFFNINQDYEFKRSIRLTDDIILDFNDEDVPVALELLNASKIFNVEKSSLTKPVGLDMSIYIGDKIKLEAKFFVLIRNNETAKPLIEEVLNNANLTASEAHFANATA